jgi:uncharacterized protein
MDITTLIDRLNLIPHPEGGFYREFYRSPLHVNAPTGERNAATAIYFALGRDDVSHLHRLKHDELWCWHEGGSLCVHCIHADGRYEQVVVGPDTTYSAVIPAGTWFGATVQGSHVLVTAVVAPGFDFADFEMAERESLTAEFPQHAAVIELLTSA